MGDSERKGKKEGGEERRVTGSGERVKKPPGPQMTQENKKHHFSAFYCLRNVIKHTNFTHLGVLNRVSAVQQTF